MAYNWLGDVIEKGRRDLISSVVWKPFGICLCSMDCLFLFHIVFISLLCAELRNKSIGVTSDRHEKEVRPLRTLRYPKPYQRMDTCMLSPSPWIYITKKSHVRKRVNCREFSDVDHNWQITPQQPTRNHVWKFLSTNMTWEWEGHQNLMSVHKVHVLIQPQHICIA